MVQAAVTTIRALLLIAAGALVYAPPASAQDTDASNGVVQQLPNPDPDQPAPPSPTPVTPIEHFTRDHAEALLNASQATDLFEIIPLEDDKVGLRHRGSGMVCRFSPDFENRINVRRPGRASSEVGCVSGPWPATFLGAMHSAVDPRSVIEVMEQTFRRESPNAQPFQANQFWPEQSRNVVYLHLVSQNGSGERSVIHAIAMRRGDWTIVSRMTYTASGDLPIMAAELAGAAHFRSIFADLEE